MPNTKDPKKDNNITKPMPKLRHQKVNTNKTSIEQQKQIQQ